MIKIKLIANNVTKPIPGRGASHDPCSDTFAGPKGFSEPETLALSEFISTFDNVKLFLSLHSYGQLLLFPYVRIKIRRIFRETDVPSLSISFAGLHKRACR